MHHTQSIPSMRLPVRRLVGTALLALAGCWATGAAQAAVCRAAPAGVGVAGATWGDAMPLPAALADSNCTDVWLQQGVYKPTSSTTDRVATFAINRPVRLYGGFRGTEGQLAERNTNPRLTVLSGDIDNNDTVDADGITVLAADAIGGNSLHVVVIGGLGGTSVGGPYTNDNTVIDGLTITGAKGASNGGGLDCNGHGEGGNCSPTIFNVTFSGNSVAGFGGGAIRNSGTSSTTISHSTFSGNSAGNGGAIFNSCADSCAQTISNSTFVGNSAPLYGGAIYNMCFSGSCTHTISNSTFVGNSGDFGGAIGNRTDGAPHNITIYNSTFSENRGFYGWTLHDTFGSKSTLVASIVWGDGVSSYGHIQSQLSSITTVHHSIVKGSGGSGPTWTADAIDGGGNLDADPLLTALANNGGYTHTMRPGASGPAVDAVACDVTGLANDQRGVARPDNSPTRPATPCDMGAMEVGGMFTLMAGMSGNGKVSGGAAPYNINCNTPAGPTDCVAQFPAKPVPDSITLTAEPASGWQFVGWENACSGTTPTCTVVMDQARHAVASFMLNRYAITPAVEPATGGTLTCPDRITHGLTETCTATVAAGFTISGITGCNGAPTGAGVTSFTTGPVTAACTVNATFAPVQTFSGTTVPSAGGTAGPATASFTGGGPSCRFDSLSTTFGPAPATLPVGATMPQGAFSFKLIGCTPGSTVNMSITWPQAVTDYQKYGRAAAGAQPSYFTPAGLAVAANTVTFSVTDGALGDDDWLADGTIVDPSGPVLQNVVLPGAAPTPVPTLSQWALVLLSLLAATVGAGMLRRTRAHS